MGITRGVRVCVFYLVFSICLLLLQLWVDRAKFKDERHSLLQQHSDNTYAETTQFYNACSPARDRRNVISILPPAYTTFPTTDTSSTSCHAVKKSYGELTPTCEKLFAAAKLTEEEEKWITDTNKIKGEDHMALLLKTEDCAWVREEFSNNFFVSAEEKRFPIAYAININQYPQQVLRFLKAIYRPHNIHCLHYDSKTDALTKQIMHNVATCLGNLFIPRKIENVYWGWYTLEEAYLSCFSDLMLAREKYQWKYVITLCGKELPLRTNAEIVSMLEPLNGTSSVQLVGEEGGDKFKYKWKWYLNTMTGWLTRKDSPQPPIPHNLKVYKSWVYLALSPQFVDYVLCSPLGKEMREYMKDVLIPEENIFAMLFMQPNISGGYRDEHKKDIFPVTSYIWLNGDHHGLLRKIYLRLFPHTICHGWRTHDICMLSARDLHRVAYRPGVMAQSSDDYLQEGTINKTYEGRDRGPLFHNRYNMEWDSVVMLCMEQELQRRNRIEYRKTCSSFQV